MRLNSLLNVNRTASGAIEAYRIVKATATDGVFSQASAASDAVCGISGVGSAADKERIDIEHAGIVPVQYGGAVAPGDFLTADASGKAIATTTDGDRVIGVAMESGGADEIGACLISPGTFAAGA